MYKTIIRRETLTTGRMIPSRTNSPPAEVSTQCIVIVIKTWITYLCLLQIANVPHFDKKHVLE